MSAGAGRGGWCGRCLVAGVAGGGGGARRRAGEGVGGGPP